MTTNAEAQAAAETYVREVITQVFDPPRDAVEDLAELIVSGVIARLPDWDEAPRLHKGASRAQEITFEQALKSASKRRRQVLGAIVALYDPLSPRTTSDYLERHLELPHTTVSATLNWLERAGLVERDHSITLPTRAGGQASPYRLLDAGRVAHREWEARAT